MRHVLHGILRNEADAAGRVSALEAGLPLRLVVCDDLGAAVSLAADVSAAPPAPRVHAQVVQALHSVCAVLPMRHGISFETETEVRELLRENAGLFRRALDDLRGCEEMGLRVICGATAGPPPETSSTTEALSPARAYLAARQCRYAARDAGRQEVERLAGRMEGVFKGLFAKCKTESFFLRDHQILSLHFLVRREETARFRDAFRRLESRAPEKLLLTGPWPPYNFAACENVIPSREAGR